MYHLGLCNSTSCISIVDGRAAQPLKRPAKATQLLAVGERIALAHGCNPPPLSRLVYQSQNSAWLADVTSCSRNINR